MQLIKVNWKQVSKRTGYNKKDLRETESLRSKDGQRFNNLQEKLYLKIGQQFKINVPQKKTNLPHFSPLQIHFSPK